MTDTPQPCPLCAASAQSFARIAQRDYCHCRQCDLVFVPSAQQLTPAEELARYRLHQNHPGDHRYRAFLNQLADPLMPCLAPGARGLDYGSGPGPTLSVMLEEQGFDMTLYDPFFAPDPAALRQTYDFITCSETVEHFAHPMAEFSRLDHLLKPGGHLGVMTQCRDPSADFSQWGYVRDETHVAFYSQATLQWIGRHWRWQSRFPSVSVVIYEKMCAKA